MITRFSTKLLLEGKGIRRNCGFDTFLGRLMLLEYNSTMIHRTKHDFKTSPSIAERLLQQYS
jgi:hypothetical protein